MAQKVSVLLIDDMDGGDAEETITFALDGMGYEIDLSEKNAAALRKALNKYINSARRTGKVGKAPTHRGGASGVRRNGKLDPTTLSHEQRLAIRAWGPDNGFEVKERGRFSNELVQAWDAAGQPMAS